MMREDWPVWLAPEWDEDDGNDLIDYIRAGHLISGEQVGGAYPRFAGQDYPIERAKLRRMP